MDIESIKRRLLVKYPLFGSVVANSKFIAEESIETAGTDGKNIYYNPKFIESVTKDQQTFIFAHEICHIAFNHIFRSEGKDKKIWNIATDSVINAFLKQDGLPIFEGGVDIPDAINYDAEEMYKKILEEKQQQSNDTKQTVDGQQKSQSKQQNSSNNENLQGQDKQSQNQSNSELEENSNEENQQQDVGHDTHSMWDKAVEKMHQEQQNHLDENQEQENKNSSEIDEKETFKQNKIERKKQLEELRKALASKSHGHINTTNSEKRNITNIGISKPLIDWRRLLKEAVKYDVDWSYQNAGIEDGVVTPYLE